MIIKLNYRRYNSISTIKEVYFVSQNYLLKEMGERIYAQRKALKLTQEQVAEKMGVSIQMISNLECGKKAIRPENLIKICKILNVSTDYILTGSNSENKFESTTNKLSHLNENELNIINNLIEYMIQSK